MDNLNEENPKSAETRGNLAKSPELNKFYRELASVQMNAVFRVMSGKNEDEIKQNALEESKRLHSLYGGKCPVGTVRNPITGECE